jgi:5-formyltetrahydrofolate cyclo-ligase
MFALKILLRNLMQYRRNGMQKLECSVLSDRIQKTLLEQHEWKSAGNINIYKNIGNEVSTELIIKDAELRSNKIIYYPTPEPKDNVMDVDLVVVPGVVFDEKRARYGRGKGYYDRFLEQLPKTTCIIGVAYDFQVLGFGWKLKLNEYDIKMDYIITERRIIQKAGILNYKE